MPRKFGLDKLEQLIVKSLFFETETSIASAFVISATSPLIKSFILSISESIW